MLSKEDKKIKNWGIHPHFYNKWVQTSTFSWNFWYIKKIELSFFQNVAKTQSVPLPSYIVFVIRCKVIFISIKHCTLNRKLDNHAMCFVLPLCGVQVLVILKNKKVCLLFHCKSSLCTVVPSIYIRTLFYFKIEKNKKERQGNKKRKYILVLTMKMFTTCTRSICIGNAFAL